MIPLVILAIEDDYDREFMTNLFMKYKDVMYRRAYGIVKEPELAEDVLQITIVKLIKKIDLLESMDPDKLPAYIVSAVKANAVNCYNKGVHFAIAHTHTFQSRSSRKSRLTVFHTC